jgi:hypothetical protein
VQHRTSLSASTHLCRTGSRLNVISTRLVSTRPVSILIHHHHHHHHVTQSSHSIVSILIHTSQAVQVRPVLECRKIIASKLHMLSACMHTVRQTISGVGRKHETLGHDATNTVFHTYERMYAQSLWTPLLKWSYKSDVTVMQSYFANISAMLVWRRNHEPGNPKWLQQQIMHTTCYHLRGALALLLACCS